MSACPIILPCIQAFAFECKLPVLPPPAAPLPQPRLERQVAFYRKYTHAILRRYVRMSMEAGKVASPLNKEMFRGKVTSYRVESFEDVVVADLCVLKSQMKEVVGNGQPGRLAVLEGRILDHEKTVQRLKGIAAAFGGLLTFAHVAIDFLLMRR